MLTITIHFLYLTHIISYIYEQGSIDISLRQSGHSLEGVRPPPESSSYEEPPPAHSESEDEDSEDDPPPPPPPPAAIDAAAMQRERIARLVSSADYTLSHSVPRSSSARKNREEKEFEEAVGVPLPEREEEEEEVKEVTMELIEEAESVARQAFLYHLKLHAPGLSQELMSQTFSGEWSWANSSIGAHRFFNKGVGWNEK